MPNDPRIWGTHLKRREVVMKSSHIGDPTGRDVEPCDSRLTCFSRVLTFSLFLEPLKSMELTKNQTNFSGHSCELVEMFPCSPRNWGENQARTTEQMLAKRYTLHFARYYNNIIQITKSLKTPLSGILSPDK